MSEYREGWRVHLALLTGAVTPRRLAAAIRERVAEAGWTQAEWSAKIGIHPSTASRAVNDSDRHPNSFKKIADHFGYSYDSKTGMYRRTHRDKTAA